MDQNFRAFKAHRASADARGIPFRLTFSEWWTAWAPHWARRHLDELCMCRHGDEGGYEVGKVYIATRSQNSIDWAINKAVATAALRAEVPLADETMGSLRKRQSEQEIDEIADALVRTAGNMTKAARMLGITFRAARYIGQKNGMTKTDLFVYGLARQGQKLSVETPTEPIKK